MNEPKETYYYRITSTTGQLAFLWATDKDDAKRRFTAEFYEGSSVAACERID